MKFSGSSEWDNRYKWYTRLPVFLSFLDVSFHSSDTCILFGIRTGQKLSKGLLEVGVVKGEKKTGVKHWKGTMKREVLIWGRKWKSNVENWMWETYLLKLGKSNTETNYPKSFINIYLNIYKKNVNGITLKWRYNTPTR